MAKRPSGKRGKGKPGTGLPRGFRPIRDTSVVSHQMLESLHNIATWIMSKHDMDVDVRKRTNRDGSIDAMLRISRLPRVFPRDKQTAFLIGVKDAMIRNRMPYVRARGIWYFSDVTDSKNYDWKRKGQVAAATYGHDFGSIAAIENWRMSMSEVLRHLKRKRNPQSFTLALYSHPANLLPRKTRKPVGESK